MLVPCERSASRERRCTGGRFRPPHWSRSLCHVPPGSSAAVAQPALMVIQLRPAAAAQGCARNTPSRSAGIFRQVRAPAPRTRRRLRRDRPRRAARAPGGLSPRALPSALQHLFPGRSACGIRVRLGQPPRHVCALLSGQPEGLPPALGSNTVPELFHEIQLLYQRRLRSSSRRAASVMTRERAGGLRNAKPNTTSTAAGRQLLGTALDAPESTETQRVGSEMVDGTLLHGRFGARTKASKALR